MNDEHDALRRLVGGEEGQYFDRKSLWEGTPGNKRPRDPREVRDHIAEYVAAFANADGGTLVLGVEDDRTLAGDRVEATVQPGLTVRFGDHHHVVRGSRLKGPIRKFRLVGSDGSGGCRVRGQVRPS